MSSLQTAQPVTTVRLNTAINSGRVRYHDSLSVKISACERQGLDTAAEEQGLTISELTRSMVDEYLEEYFRNKKL